MLERIHLNALIAVAVLFWVPVLLVKGVPVTVEYFKPYSIVTLLVWAVVQVFDRWLWRWSALHPWFVKRPVVAGTWRARFLSNWVDQTTGKPAEGTGYMVVRQTYSQLSMRLLTAESSSELLVDNIVRSPDGTFRIFAVYRNEPAAAVMHRSPMHYGAFRLTVQDTPFEIVKGVYWTDRLTRGDLQMSDRIADIHDSYAAARLAFRD